MNATWITDSNFRDLLLKLGIPINYTKGVSPFITNYNLFSYRYQHCDASLRIRTIPFFHVRNQGKYTQFYIAYTKHDKISTIPAKDEKAFLGRVKDSFSEQLIACSIIQKDLLRVINTLLLSPKFYQHWLVSNHVSYLSDLDFCSEGYYRQKHAQGLKHIRYRKVSKALLPVEGVYTLSVPGDGTRTQQKLGKDQKEASDTVVLPTLENFFEDKLLVLSRMHNGSFMNEFFSYDLYSRLGPDLLVHETAFKPQPPQRQDTSPSTEEQSAQHIYSNILSVNLPGETSEAPQGKTKQSALISFLLSGYLNDVSKMPATDQTRVSVIMECMLRQFSALDDLIQKNYEQKRRAQEALVEEQATATTRPKSNHTQRSGSKASSSAGATAATTNQPPDAPAVTEVGSDLSALVQHLSTQSLEENHFDISAVDTMLLSTELGDKLVAAEEVSLKDEPRANGQQGSVDSFEEKDTHSSKQLGTYFSARTNCPVSLYTEPLMALLETSTSNRQELISISSAIISAATGVTSLTIHTLQNSEAEHEINSNKLAPSLLNAFFGVMPHRLTTTYESMVKVSSSFTFQIENYVEAEAVEKERHINDIRLKAASYDLLALISLLDRLKKSQLVPSDRGSCKDEKGNSTRENGTMPCSEEADDESLEKADQIDYYQMHVKESAVTSSIQGVRSSSFNREAQDGRSYGIHPDGIVSISFGAVMMEFSHKDLDYTMLLDTLSSMSTYSISVDPDNKSVNLVVTSDVVPLQHSKAHLLAQFKDDLFSLFNTVPMFGVWINTPFIQSVLTDESFLSNNYPQIWNQYYTDTQAEQRSKSTQQGKAKEEKQVPMQKEESPESSKNQPNLTEYVPLLPSIVPLTRRYRIPGDRPFSFQMGSSVLYDPASATEQSITETHVSSLKNVVLSRDARADKPGAGKEKDPTKATSSLRDASCANSFSLADDRQEPPSLSEYARPIFPLASEFVDTSSISPPTHMFLSSTGNLLNSNLVLSECFGSVGLASNYWTKQAGSPQTDEVEQDAESPVHEQPPAPDHVLYVPNRLLATYIQEPEQLQLHEDDDKKKTLPLLLDTTVLPDFDINIDTLATQFDLRSADTSAYVAQYSRSGAMHCIESIPASGLISHKIVNGSGLSIRASLRPINLSTVVVGQISTPFSPTPEIDLQYAERCIERMLYEASKPCTADSSMQRSLGAAKTKKDRERESLQQIEWRRRKRKLTELKALVDEEKARRERALPAPGTSVLGIRPTSSYLHLSLASRGIHIIYMGSKILIKYRHDLLMFLYIGQQRLKLTKIFLDVDFNVLEVTADSDPWLSLLYEFKQHYTGKATRFPIIRLSYELRRDMVRIYAEFPTSHYAMYVDLDEAGNLEEDAASILSIVKQDSAVSSMLHPTEKTLSIPDALEGIDTTKASISDLQATSPPQLETPGSKTSIQTAQDASLDDETDLYDDIARKGMFISQTDKLSRHFSTSFLVIFTCPTSTFYEPFKAETLKESPMPCTGTKLLNKGNIYYAKGIHARVIDPDDFVTSHELTTVDLPTIVPYIFTSDRIMLHYCFFKNIMTIAHLSDNLVHKDAVEILRASKDLTDLDNKYWFENIISNIFTIDKQIIHEDPSRFVRALKKLCTEDTCISVKTPTVFVQLPIGLMAVFDEHDKMNIMYNSESGLDTVSIPSDGSVQVTLGDALRLQFFSHKADYYVSMSTEADRPLDKNVALNAVNPDVFTYRLTTQPELISATVSMLAGYPRPGLQFRTIGRDPYQFLPNIWNIFRKDEKLPRSLVHFTPGITQLVPTGDNMEIDKESVLHLGSPLPGPYSLGFQLVINVSESSDCCADFITALLRLLQTDPKQELTVDLHRAVADSIYLDLVQPLMSCTNPLQRAVANYSLPDYAKNIVFSKYDIVNQQVVRESNHSTKSNSEEPLFNLQRSVSRGESMSVSKDSEEKPPDNSEEQRSKEDISKSKSEKFGTDVGHSSFVDESKGVLEDGQSTIPYLDVDNSSSTLTGDATTEDLIENTEDGDGGVTGSRMKVDFLRKGLTDFFWDSEEGQAYLIGGPEGYKECVNKYHDLAATVLGKERVAEQEHLPNRSIHRCVENHLKAITLPRSLPPPYSRREEPESSILPSKEEFVEHSLLTRPLNQVETNKSIRNQLQTVATETMHAAACRNITFAAREDLRKVTIPTTYKIPYTRHVLVTPTKIRLGSMLAPADLTTARVCFKNTGHMPVHLRYDLVHTEKDVPKEERIIVDICMTQHKGGIPPGMTATVVMKIKTPIQVGHFNTVAFFKTEEEVIAIPIEGVVQSGSPRSTLTGSHTRGRQNQVHHFNTLNNISNNISDKSRTLQGTTPTRMYQDDDSSDEE
ncbi:Hypothetical protein GLP15_3804 [Giardia lamblia P15]|uniref:Uncharacterized protein n=1 Tax=Giardia intestinalis (strain P15) TaxID=658858 RepID=E1F254_GIAIA|nr:Hypothetical protein GLP15_3804 [Giardia lamblia P15]